MTFAKKMDLLKARKVYHQPNPPQNPMTLEDEIKAIDLCYVLFIVSTLHLGPALWSFMTKKLLNDSTRLIVDSYLFLKEMISHRRTNLFFFTTNSPSDLTHLETAQAGRNAVAHGYFDEVSVKWSAYLLSWVEVLKMIDANEAAIKLKKIHEHLTTGNMTALDILLCSYTAPDFMENGTKVKQPTDLTREEYLKTVRLQTTMYRLLTETFGPALRDEYLTRKGIVRVDSEIDTQNLLFDLLEHWLNQPEHPDVLANVQKLETAKDGRNAVCHADLTLISTDWERFLTSWNEVSVLISDNSAAQMIASIHVELKVNINQTLITGSFFPSFLKANVRSKTMKIKLTKKPAA